MKLRLKFVSFLIPLSFPVFLFYFFRFDVSVCICIPSRFHNCPALEINYSQYNLTEWTHANYSFTLMRYSYSVKFSKELTTLRQPDFGLPLENILLDFLLFYKRKMVHYLLHPCNGKGFQYRLKENKKDFQYIKCRSTLS